MTNLYDHASKFQELEIDSDLNIHAKQTKICRENSSQTKKM